MDRASGRTAITKWRRRAGGSRRYRRSNGGNRGARRDVKTVVPPHGTLVFLVVWVTGGKVIADPDSNPGARADLALGVRRAHAKGRGHGEADVPDSEERVRHALSE